ncbi:MAG: HTH-type transcriptional regulator BhcR [Paracoccaceae bacterium]
MNTDQKRQRGRPRGFSSNPESNRIQSLDRALNILRVLADGEGLSLTEVAEASGQAPATTYRVLTTFQLHQMVEFQKDRQLWHVGPEAFRIGSAFLKRTDIVERARPVMRELMLETGETANLAIADGAEVVFLSQVESHEHIRAFFRPGTRGPIHASGIGKALMAYFPDAMVERMLSRHGLEAFTGKTLIRRDDLLRDLAAIRQRGWSIDDEERTSGMRCIAAPIFNAYGEAVAGISISGPTVRLPDAGSTRLGQLVLAAADRITAASGGQRPNSCPNGPALA